MTSSPPLPASIPGPAIRHSIDRLVVSGRRLFGWGWAAHAEREIASVHLELEGEGWKRRLQAGIGLSRHDVEDAYPDLVNAAASGFVVTGYIPERTPLRAWLDVELQDGRRERVDVTHVVETRYAKRRRWRLAAWVAHAVWRRLKRGDIAGIVRRAKTQTYVAPSLDDIGVVEALIAALRRHRGLSIVFDHNMGGGANQYCRNIVAERNGRGEAVLLCTYNLPMLEYRLHVHEPGAESSVFRISTFLALERILEKMPSTELFVNSPVSFDEPLLLAEWLARMRAEFPASRLTVTAHDYFSICPSFVLLDADGRYCGIPEISRCAECLRRHPASYVALSPPTEIGPWRALWGRCLQAADEIRCFSESTRSHLLRAYPTLDLARIAVVPHKPDYVPARLPRAARGPLVIGVIGEISPQKGAWIVRDMVSLIERDGIDARVVVLGTLNVAYRSDRLRVSGAYRREELVDLIEEHGINMLFFPSIWPETFSYVVAEMVALRLPVVAFDLGAPGERLRQYPMARLCDEVSAEAALAALLDFHRQIERPSASVA